MTTSAEQQVHSDRSFCGSGLLWCCGPRVTAGSHRWPLHSSLWCTVPRTIKTLFYTGHAWKRDWLVNSISKIKSHIYADTIFEFKKRKDDFRFCKTSDHSYHKLGCKESPWPALSLETRGNPSAGRGTADCRFIS